MSRPDPLVAEVWHGLVESGPAQLAQLNYVAIQAAVLFLWWPKSTLLETLQSERGPDTLLAVVMAVGATLAYYSIRAGAEEILLPGQQSLREWALATPLGLPRILRGYLGGHLLQTLHAIALSSPLLLAAFTVAGGEWPALAWSLTAALVQATFYRLVGAVVYMAIGHHGAATFWTLRAVLVAGYALAGALAPVTSHLVVSYQLFHASPTTHTAGGVAPSLVAFLVVYGVLSVALAAVLHLLLSRQRRSAIGSSPAGGGRGEI